MAFDPPDGILDIGNATLRVGKLEVAETSGLNQGLQNIIKNDLLITENTEYTTNQKWGLKLPTTWVGEFEVKGHSGKYIDFNFYNENSASNAQGYNLTFKDTTMTLRYDGGSALGGGAATIPTIVGAYRKVNIFFERGVISVSIDGTRYLYFKESDGYNQSLGVASRVVSATGSAFVNLFIEQNAADSAFKNLRIVNGRFISDKTSNIAFIGGNLGVGVNSPKETLDIRGNMHFNRVSNVSQISVDSNVVTEYTGPHDRPLRKYPEVALTADAETASGYKGYKVTVSSLGGGDGTGYHAFDGNYADGSTVWGSGDFYNSSDGDATVSGAASTNVSGVSGAVIGEWIGLQLPFKIRLQDVKIAPQSYAGTTYGPPRTPTKGVVAGSIDGTNWELVHSFTTSGISQIPLYYLSSIGPINSTKYYNYFRIIAEEIVGGTNGTRFNLEELCFYGHEEGSGSLDTTLKSVYNVPATTGTQLEVYYDGQDYTQASDFTGTGGVVDKAGGDQDGTAGSGVSFDSTYKAFVFDGTTNGKITSSVLPSDFIGDIQHTVSLWFKIDSSSTVTNACLFDVHKPGTAVSYQRIDFRLQTGAYYQFHYDFWSNWTRWKSPFGTELPKDEWIHVTTTYSGGLGSGPRNVYMNGRLCELVEQATVVNTNPLAVQADSILLLGMRPESTNLFDGSIANFRLYSKALNADQVKELYDYQKDYFLGSKSQVTLYKGHLGVGVTEPSGQLELAGDERLQEYPPRGLVGDPLVFDPAGNAYDYNVEGHGVFKLLSSYRYHASTSDDRRIYEFFDKDVTVTQTHWASFNSSAPYDAAGGSGAWITTLDGGSTITAHIAEIQMPYKITLKGYTLTSGSQVIRALKTAMIVGSNDGNVYHVLHNVSDFGFTATSQTKEYTVDNATTPYRIFRLLLMNTNGHTACNMRQWRLFGTPGPTTLDKGSLSLTRSLDVPRVSRYDVDTETPRPEKLVVDFDTTVNSSPTDISGQGNHGTMVGATYSPAAKAFSFDGTDDYIEAVTNLESGNRTLCFSMWIKPETDNRWFIDLGKNTATGGSFFAIRYDTYYQFNVKNGNHIHISAGPLNTWEHLVIIYHGTGSTKTAGTIEGYVNGVLENLIESDFADDQLNLSANPPIEIGARTGASTYTYFDGQISNFKLYDVALEPSEVRKLYNLGRTGRSMVISDTAVGIGKVPEAQLDVRGNISCDGILKPYTCAFSAYVSSGGNSSATGKFPAESVHFNIGNCYNTSTYEFTAPVHGIYHMSFSAFTNTGATSSSRIYALINGSIVEQVGATIEQHGNSLSLTVEMQAGETFAFTGGAGVPIYYFGANGHNRFSGHLICAL